MKAKLKIKDDFNGCYLYISDDNRDYLLTPEQITDQHKRRAIRDLVNNIEIRLYAYERYKSAMNEAFVILMSRGVEPDVQKILRDCLHNFGDLSGIGKVRG